jgi:predicted extracellular nuclease
MRTKLMILGLAALMGQAMAGGVFFSEYAEGSSNNKALEIYNATDAEINMADYATWRISNGGDWLEGEGNSVEFGTLEEELQTDLLVGPGETFVIVNSSAMPEMQALADVIGTSACWFNGDDAMGLAHFDGAVWNLIDAIGEEGADPGSGWTVSGVSNGTKDHTIVRLPSVLESTTDWTAGAIQWQVLAQNDISGLGSHVIAGGGTNLAPVFTSYGHTPEFPSETDDVTYFAYVSDVDGTVEAVVMETTEDFSFLEEVAPGYWEFAAEGGPPPCYSMNYSFTAMDNEEASTTTPEVTLSTPCPKLIAEIQGEGDASPFVGEVVTIGSAEEWAVVTAIATSGAMGFFVQDSDDVRSGIQVYTGSVPEGLSVGDCVTVTGEVAEYNGQTEIVGATWEVYDLPSFFPEPVLVYAAECLEDYESMLVRIEGGTCDNSDLGYGEWLLADDSGEVRVDDWFAPFTPTEGECYNVQGILFYSYGNFKLEPLAEGDITTCGGTVDIDEVVSGFALNGNYPNPFNPTTQIEFTLDATAVAELIVFDIMGREVATLVNGMTEAGTHQVTFDASNLSSGIYFYQLNAEGRSETQRMLLVR